MNWFTRRTPDGGWETIDLRQQPTTMLVFLRGEAATAGDADAVEAIDEILAERAEAR